MKKLTLIIAMLMQFAVLFGQTMDYQRINSDRHDFKKPDFRSTKTVPVWEVTFEEEIPVWTFGSITGTKTWYVGDTTPTNGYTYSGVPTPPMWIYMGYRYVKDFSASGNNFAYVDGISDLLGFFPTGICESYIRFDNIDLSATSHPKLVFYQNYRPFNTDECYVDFSQDGGATWTSIEVNSGVAVNQYGDTYCEIIAPSSLAGSEDVSLRFRWNCPSADVDMGMGYGWEIDDVAFVENPDYDIKVLDARMNFFQYIDYTEPDNSQYFHSSSHYGRIPRNQFMSDYAMAWFNVMVQNKGNVEVEPVVNVRVLDPSLNEVFNNSSTLDETELLYTFSVDTVDLINADFYPGSEPETGLYTVIYSVVIDGQTDANDSDNYYTTYFEITENQYSRSLNNNSGSASIANYSSGGISGEMFGATFQFLAEDQINSIDVFIAENTTPGVNYLAHVFIWDTDLGDYVDSYESELLTVSQSDPGTWKNIQFTNPANLTFQDGEGIIEIIVALECIYNSETEKFSVGYDTELRSSFFGTKWYFLNGSNMGEWIYLLNFTGALSIKLNTGPIEYICPDDMQLCINNPVLDLSTLVATDGVYSGSGVVDNVFYANIAGLGEHVITFNATEYQCSFSITVIPAPVQKNIIISPANALLTPGQSGNIIVENADSGIFYWTTLSGEDYTNMELGEGVDLLLGNMFSQGTYQIWSATAYGGCLLPQANVTFVENSGVSKIVAFAGYGDPQLLFCSGESTISLYREYLNSEEELITELVAEQIVGASGNVVFEGLEPGNYYISSVLNNNQNDSIAENAFYDNALIFDDATLFSLEDAEIKIINLNHPIIEIVEGTNTGGGTVGDQEEGKSLNPLEGKVVALRNADDDEIIAISVTDENGNYEFEAIPDNTNINIFVTMPESPVWTAYNVLTGVGETISVDFIVSGSSVFPATSLLEQEENVLETIMVSPNPCTDKLNLGTDSNWDQIKIFNCTGELIINIGGTGINSVDVSSLSAGQYIIVGVNQDSAVGINKFVKY